MNAGADQNKDLVVVGQIGRVHGIKGWLKLNSFTSPAENILSYPKLNVVGGGTQILEIDESKQQSNGLLVHFVGFDTPEQARKLTGLELGVEADVLPLLEEGEYYWHQLLGLRVVNRQGAVFGRVSHLLETGANDVLVVVPDENSVDERERLIPFLKGSVVSGVDLEAGELEVEWEVDYLA